MDGWGQYGQRVCVLAESMPVGMGKELVVNCTG